MSITLITGGSRSGKSHHALQRAEQMRSASGGMYFLATAQALDTEMALRIENHRRSRPGEFITIEEPFELTRAIAALGSSASVVVVDSLTLWISNLLLREQTDAQIVDESQKLADTLRLAQFHTIVVSDEVGSGIVPENALARRFRDLLGLANQSLAAAADEVTLMIAGYPLRVK